MFAAITGASGHLGANLVRALIDKEWRIKALIHQDTRALDDLGIELVSGNILNEESLKLAFTGVDIVFHLAGRISVVSWDWKEVRAVNIIGVQNVINACSATGVKRLVHVSSFHAHQQEPLNESLDESRPLFNDSTYPPYNYSKAQGESLVREAIAKGLDAIIINPTGMLGPNDFKPSHFGKAIISLAMGQLPALVNAGLNWVDNRDVVNGMIAACERADAGAKYILGGHWASLKDIAYYVNQLSKAKLPRVVLPLWLAKIGAPVATLIDRIQGKDPLFTPIAMMELESNPKISHLKASKELGYQPRQLEQTIADTIDWFRINGYLN